jgi:hypothetical protein
VRRKSDFQCFNAPPVALSPGRRPKETRIEHTHTHKRRRSHRKPDFPKRKSLLKSFGHAPAALKSVFMRHIFLHISQ